MAEKISRDLYEIIGVSPSADQSEIKKAYRARARECHPDVAPDDPESEGKFKELNFAYQVLSDPEKRKVYDTWGLDGLNGRATPDFGGFGFDDFGSISDLFEAFFNEGFGGGPFRTSRSTARSRRFTGKDIHTSITITLEEVLTGTEREMNLRRRVACESCGGSGVEPGGSTVCQRCHGSGRVETSRQSFFGTFMSSRVCPACGGSGEVIKERCRKCKGNGFEWEDSKIEVEIPPGVENGDRLLIKGKGEGNGDLYVTVEVESHPHFEREGKNLLTSVAVDMVEAALGANVKVPSLDGDLQLEVPPGTQPGSTLRIKGKGLPELHRGKRGDILVQVDVSVPKHLTSGQKKILESYLQACKGEGEK